ncbi:Recombination-associated protein rdgC [Achromobacter sp. 2789STDY5608633]|jgi:recombination associated protein RdgC|uniref:recombination-associated protein RdgC n=1 Tax=Achromobacter sp. 2789STDY5608633 TaxID=1806501 RepID=UPI0006C635F4|nr:recombination-associated protein RdgC [Achromobacter sp. 2789STDY5608633]CUJ69504.1 Recombination-associated protein rdgC [Achromobacter sp. 2789STDY5608633]
MIKNATLYRLSSPLETHVLLDQLERGRFKDIASLEASSIGFVPVVDNLGLGLIHEVAGIRVGAVRRDEKKIPGNALKRLLKQRCEEIEKQQGYAPGRKQKAEIKERIIDEHLPKQLPTTKQTNFVIWEDLLLIDTNNNATAELVIGLFAKHIDPFPVEMLYTAQSPAAAMTDWLVTDEAPDSFSVDQEVEMKSSGESRASVRWLHESVAPTDASDHMRQGKQCCKMALTWQDRISFVLSEKGVLARIKPLDVLKAEEVETDEAARLDGEIALIGGEMRKLINDLIAALGGEKHV